MGKIPALLWFYGLNAACIVSLQHDAGSIWSVNQGETATIPLQMAQFIDKSDFVHTEIGRNRCNVFIGQAHVTLPAAACTAALAGMNNLGLFGLHFIFPKVYGQML